MSDDEFDDDDAAEPDAETLDDGDLDEDALDEDDDDDLDDLAIDEELVDGAVVEGAVVVAVEGAVEPVVEAPVVGGEDDEEEGLDLDEELHPDDVEAPLDALLQEKTAAQTLEDDEEELEEEEPEGDERGEGPTKIVPRRADEFVCRSCFLVLPRHQLADEGRMLCRDCA